MLIPAPASCQGWGHQVQEEDGPHSWLLPSSEDRGFLVLCPQPQSGSPQADTLPRPRSGRATPAVPPPLPLPGWGTWGPSVSVVCVRVAPGPEGCCKGMLCLLGSVHTVKSNCLKAVVLGFVFFPRFFPLPLYPVGKEALAALGSTVAPACSCLTHFSSTLCCVWKESGPRGTAHSAGTGWVDGPTPHPPQSHMKPRDWGLVGSGCFGEPHIPPVEELPAGCSYLQPRPAWHSRAPSTAGAHSGSSGAEEVPGGVGGCHRLCWQSEGVEGLLPTFPVGSQLSLPLGVK